MARIRLALILLHLTVLPHPARRALAEVAMHNARSVNDLIMSCRDCKSCQFFPTQVVLVQLRIRNDFIIGSFQLKLRVHIHIQIPSGMMQSWSLNLNVTHDKLFIGNK